MIARSVYAFASLTYNPCRSTVPGGCDLLFSAGWAGKRRQSKTLTIFDWLVAEGGKQLQTRL